MNDDPRWDSDRDAAWSDNVQRDVNAEHGQRLGKDPTPKSPPTLRAVPTPPRPEDLEPKD